MPKIVLYFLFACILFSCKRTNVPKPMGYLRIDLPKPSYQTVQLEEMPFVFNISTQAAIEIPTVEPTAMTSDDHPAMTSGKSSSTAKTIHWLNIDYPMLQAKIYCSYLPISPQTLEVYEQECRRFSMLAAGNAHTINEKKFENKEMQVYGLLFLTEGASVSPVQFILTDSVSHFFRGALYYKEHLTNPDSIAPIAERLSKDVVELVQSFFWK